jgi:hypothetical protein
MPSQTLPTLDKCLTYPECQEQELSSPPPTIDICQEQEYLPQCTQNGNDNGGNIGVEYGDPVGDVDLGRKPWCRRLPSSGRGL